MLDKKIKNRRRGTDPIIQAISFITGISWLVVFGIFIMFSTVKSGIRSSGSAPHALRYAFYLMIIQALLCAAGLAISSSRLKRKTDHLNVSLLVFLVLSIFGIIAYSIYV